MSNLNQIIDYTKLFQDVELATAVGQLKQNPAQLQQFLQIGRVVYSKPFS